jgi:hypothetical protein
MFLYCEICAAESRSLIKEAKGRTGWKAIDEIEMEGNCRGRLCDAKYGSASYHLFIRFDEDGSVSSSVESD